MALCNTVGGAGRARVLHGHAALLHGSSWSEGEKSQFTVKITMKHTDCVCVDRIHYIFVP